MAVVLVRLKLRLLVNGVRLSPLHGAGLVLGLVLGLPVAGGGFLLLAAPWSPAVREVVYALAFSGLWLAWLVGPPVFFGMDETLDPSRLALLPIPRRRLMAGLLGASATGTVPLTTLVILSGAIAGARGDSARVAVSAAAVLCAIAMCVATARAVVTALAALLRSRRARDVSLVALAVLGVVAGIAPQLLTRSFDPAAGPPSLQTAGRFADALLWLPGGLPARAALAAHDGRWAAASAALGASAAIVAALLAWWSASLQRALSADAAVPQARGRSEGLLSGWRAWLPATPWGASAAKELLYFWRDPRLRAGLIGSAVFASMFSVSPLLWRIGTRQPAVFLGSAPALFLAMNAVNQFGFDGASFWTPASALRDVRDAIVGKSLAYAALGAPLTVVPSAVLAAITGGWVLLPVTLCLAAMQLGLGLGVANVVSVRSAWAMPESPSNPFAMNAGQGFTSALSALGAVVLVGILQLPVTAAAVLAAARFRPALAVVAPAGVLWGWLVWRSGTARAAGILRRTMPEFLQTISPRASA